MNYPSSEGNAILGLKDKALEIMEGNLNKNLIYFQYLYLANNPHYNNIKDDPRFEIIKQKLEKVYQERLNKYRD